MQDAFADPEETNVGTHNGSLAEDTARISCASSIRDSSDEEELEDIRFIDDDNNKEKAREARKCALACTLKSGYRFVYKARQRWQVRVKHKGRVWYCGVYNTKEDAARAAGDGRC